VVGGKHNFTVFASAGRIVVAISNHHQLDVQLHRSTERLIPQQRLIDLKFHPSAPVISTRELISIFLDALTL
jgi:hypothetical protein